MKILIFLISLMLIISCTSKKGVYWCGDHACINKKEREAYFKKTMIVEIKYSDEINTQTSEYEKILKQAKVKEKKIMQ